MSNESYWAKQDRIRREAWRRDVGRAVKWEGKLPGDPLMRFRIDNQGEPWQYYHQEWTPNQHPAMEALAAKLVAEVEPITGVPCTFDDVMDGVLAKVCAEYGLNPSSAAIQAMRTLASHCYAEGRKAAMNERQEDEARDAAVDSFIDELMEPWEDCHDSADGASGQTSRPTDGYEYRLSCAEFKLARIERIMERRGLS